jgi:hypothetical protein
MIGSQYDHPQNAAKGALPGPILLCSQEKGIGSDLAGGLAIAILSACFDEQRRLVKVTPELSKEDIKRRMQWVIAILPNFKPPSRGHLLRINEILLSGPYKDNEEDTLVHQMNALSSQ